MNTSGDVVWCCMPRLDSEPVFGSLLDEDGGVFSVSPDGGGTGTMRYIENTNVLETRFEAPGGAFKVIDFAPRFVQFGRTFRPAQLVRIVEPIHGTPRIRISCEPVAGWSKLKPSRSTGSHHISYDGYSSGFRLTTDLPLAYIGSSSFALTQRGHLVLSWGEPVHDTLASVCGNFLRETVQYWKRWVKHCNLPPFFQHEVIRSALALKLHCFEDTGAIVAAMTTSLPEAPGSGRTWDYRYCWLRDAYYSLGAFRSLGHFEEREQFLNYLVNVVTASPELELSPLYTIDASRPPSEVELPRWRGFEGHGPVREGNAAASQKQSDIYGELVLALVPLFLDERFRHEQTETTLELLIRLARRAIALAGTPDNGIWEVRRSQTTAQTFGSIMSWAAADRMIEIARRHAPALMQEFEGAAARLRDEVLREAWNPEIGALTAAYGGTELDAAVLHAVTLRLLPREDKRAGATVDAVIAGLSSEGWLYRYTGDDGLGQPSNAFVICSFWLVEALAALGRHEQARQVMRQIGAGMPPLGLLSEDYDPVGKRFWGNYPQAYSHVGMIRAAFAASPPWSEVW